MEQVLQNINRLNRNLESVIAVSLALNELISHAPGLTRVFRWAMNLDL
jgi:hypothetical protein